MTIRRILALCAYVSAAAILPAAFAVPALAQTASGQWTANTAGHAPTPPMGWNSWNAFLTEIDEEKVMGSAQVIVDKGLAKKGYVYINIDDGWWLKRRTADGKILVRTSVFPSAKIKGSQDTSFRPFTDRLHKMGLKAGIYTDIGRNSCGQAFMPQSPNRPEGTQAEQEIGLEGHTDKDIKLFFKDWGFDYIKVDACGVWAFDPVKTMARGKGHRMETQLVDRAAINRTDIAAVRARYQAVRDALIKYNPDNDFVLSLCLWGAADVRRWGKDVGNMVRTSDDITPDWTRMLYTFDTASRRALYAHPGSWNDPDMLYVGKGEFDANHLTEARSHFALWAVVNAPLLIGYDLRKAPQELLDIWGNAGLIALNQDKAGNQAVLAYDSDDVQIFAKTLSDPSRKGVVIINRGLGI